MRLTCLKCGHQTEIVGAVPGTHFNCVCGEDHSIPTIVDTGTCPNRKAADKSRAKAFRAAGVTKNFGGFALGISLLGALFFPIALLGAGIGIFVLTMMRGPLARYSGRRAALGAVVIGVIIFVGEGSLAMDWLRTRQRQRVVAIQATVSEDLRALLRAQRLFRATHDTYGTFREFRFRPPAGNYTYYLGPEDLVEAKRDGEDVADPLPSEYAASVSENAFTAFAVANLDDDPHLDVWRLTDFGTITQLIDDGTDETVPGEVATEGVTDDATDEGTDEGTVDTVEPEDSADAADVEDRVGPEEREDNTDPVAVDGLDDPANPRNAGD